jgi:pSer/pThr/pTyr-binding forkhead associated (FHA) protein
MKSDFTDVCPYLAALDGYPVQPAIYVFAGEQCLIGRAVGSTVCVQRDGVSRRHAVVFRHEEAYHITDQQSSWGTYVNGERLTPLEPYRLPPNAQIGLGSPTAILRFCDPDPTRPPPETAGGATPVLVHDDAHQCFILHGQPLELPFLAYQLLVYLYHNQGTICRATRCIRAVWDIDEYGADEIIDRLYRLMSELRLALDDHQAQVEPARRMSIENHRRRGYRLVLPDEPAAS